MMRETRLRNIKRFTFHIVIFLTVLAFSIAVSYKPVKAKDDDDIILDKKG